MIFIGKETGKHSEAYILFKKQLRVKGKEKLDGYQPDLLDSIFESERKEIEKDVYSRFVKKDNTGLAFLMPQLTGYDGISALKKKLSSFSRPCAAEADVALALYEATKKEQYLETVMRDYRTVPFNTSIVASLSRLAKDSGVFAALSEIYVNDGNRTNRICAAKAMLWARGYLKDIDDIGEMVGSLPLIGEMDAGSREARRDMLKKKGF